MKKTIWIINQYASHLKTRHEELAKTFSAKGYRVAVITSSFHHGQRKYLFDEPVVYRQLCEGVTYVYLRSGPSYRTNGAGRIFNMLDFCRRVRRERNRIAKRLGAPGYVIASSAPPFVWETGYRTAKKFGARFIAEFRDVWPHALTAVQGLSAKHPLVLLLSAIEKRAYRRADVIVPTMPGAADHVVEVSGVPREKICWMPNGINTAEVDAALQSPEPLPAELDAFLSDHWCCVYIGSIVKSECLDYLVRAIGSLREKGIFFAIVGEGHEKENLARLIEENGYDNVRLFPFLERRLIPKALDKAGCCVAACRTGAFGLSMYKLNDYLYSGRPTVFAYDRDSVVRQAEHYAIPYGDEEQFRDAVCAARALSEPEVSALAEKARALIREEYDFKAIGTRYLQAILME